MHRLQSVSAGHVVGVDIGGTKLLAGAVGPGLEVHHQTRRDVWNVSLAALVDAIASAVEEIAAAVGPVEAVGLGVPCTIDRRTGIAVQAVHLPITDVHLAAVVGERVGVPVVVDNDANCAVLAEARFGVARGLSEIVLLTLGTGIGGGLVLGGELYRGAVGAGAEMGHMVIDMDGPPCQGNCPNRGCLEALASGTALVREAALRVARRPDTPLGLALEEGELLTGRARDRARVPRRPGGARRDRDGRAAARRRPLEPREHLQPRDDRDRRRRDRRGRAPARAGPRGARRPRARAGARPRAGGGGGVRRPRPA